MQSAKARAKKAALANSTGGESQLKKVRLLSVRHTSGSAVVTHAVLSGKLAGGVTHKVTFKLQNQAAMSKLCSICRQPFHFTSKRELLEEHAASKHSKSAFKDCFPNEG